jgi:hypothetical protein
MSEAAAMILSAVIGAVVGGVFALAGVWIGYYFSRRASEGDRQTELQFTIYKKVEELKNLLMAFKREMIAQETLHEKWTRATEEILVALIRSGLSKDEKKKVLHAINGRWENPESIKKLEQLADDLLKKLDSEYADAASELLDESGVKPEDIDPVVLTSKSSGMSEQR